MHSKGSVMKYIKELFFGILSLFLFAGCSNPPERSYAIAANSWIGYTPIAYAYEKGWLKEQNIRLKWTGSLSESVVLANNGLCDALFSTQFEVLSNKGIFSRFFPVFSVDRSFGADKIMINIADPDLSSYKRIDVYMEFGSVNQALLEAFLKEYDIKAKIHLHNGLQDQFIKMDFPKPSIVITYEPYASILKKRGFTEVASTKTLHSIFVLDLFFATTKLSSKQRKFIYDQFWRAYQNLQKDPLEFYKTVQIYLDGMSYEDFKNALKEIEWLPHLNEKMLSYLKKEGFDTESMIP